MASWTRAGRSAPWSCARCGGEAGDELGLLDHQEWCLGDGLANAEMLTEVAQREGELTQEALVAAARHRRAGYQPDEPSADERSAVSRQQQADS